MGAAARFLLYLGTRPMTRHAIEGAAIASVGLAAWAFVINPAARFIAETLPVWTLALCG